MPVTVNTDLTLHTERGREWDGDAARSAMASRCESDDGVMADCMGAGFIWRNPDEDETTIGAYDLPVADVFGGDLHLVLSGVQAAANSISPERTPGSPRALDASESELSRMRSAVETILARFAREFDDESIRAPWEAETAAAVTDDEDEDERRRRRYETASACDCNCRQDPEPPITGPDQTKETTAMPEPTAPAVPRSRVLRASATGGEWRPPTEHFANPHLDEPTKLTVTSGGRVYGHLATWDQPHIGYDGKLVYPPRSSTGEYEYFRQSKVVTDDGSALAVGLITMATGHADESLSADAAAAHYDNTGTMVAACNIGEDSIGIWLAGSMLPDVSPEQRNRFSLARVSGDWRQPRPGAGLELIAALSVPNPGFPVRQSPDLLAGDRMTLAASGLVRGDGGQIRTFITAGAAVVDQAQQDALTEAIRTAIGEDFVNSVKTAVIDAIRAEQPPVTPQNPVSPEGAATDSTGGDESVPAADGEPATEGEAAPVATPAPVTDSGEGAAPPAKAAEPAAAAPSPVPEPDRGATVAASLAARARAHKGRSARAKLLAAAGGRTKKA